MVWVRVRGLGEMVKVRAGKCITSVKVPTKMEIGTGVGVC